MDITFTHRAVPHITIRDVLEKNIIFNFKRATIFDKGKNIFFAISYARLKP